MKTRRVATSACLSTLLAVSMTPLSYATVGTPIHPLAAQQAFKSAANGFGAAGWAAPSAAEIGSIPMPESKKSAPASQPKSDPVMTDELMARLIKVTRSFVKIGSVAAPTCKVLDLCDGTAPMPLKMAEAEIMTDGAEHYFCIPPNGDSTNILILRKKIDVLESFLIDKTGKLRAAAVQTNGVARLITNEKAAEQFKKELALFAAEAAGLPPTGTAVAGTN